MLTAVIRLEKIVAETPARLLTFTEEEASRRPAPGKWSRKELIGHLVDSASNNHQRFVRMPMENRLHLPQYAQDEWVENQKYQQRSWEDIVELWTVYNRHLLHVLRHIDERRVSNTAIFPEYGEKTLQFIIDDYVDHLEHHLKQVFS